MTLYCDADRDQVARHALRVREAARPEPLGRLGVHAFFSFSRPSLTVPPSTQGFFCVGCPKLFPLVRPPQASPLPGQKRRATGPLTAKRLLAQRRATAKRNAEAAQQRPSGAATKRAPGEKVKWTYRGQVGGARSHSKRQALSQALGPSFDGSQGVDSQDILNIPACVDSPPLAVVYKRVLTSRP